MVFSPFPDSLPHIVPLYFSAFQILCPHLICITMYHYLACDCNVDGSILAANGLPFCNKDTGECVCRLGATGSQCEGCMVS